MDRSYQSVRVKSRRLTLSALVMLLLAAACSPAIPKPSSDSTPPTLRWHIINKADNSTQDISGSGMISTHKGDFFVVTLFAEDPQGIHKIDLASRAFWQCVRGGDISNAGPSLGATASNTLQPDSQGNVVTSTFLIQNAGLGSFACGSGFTFASANLTFSGQGENYFNGTTKATFTFDVSP